MDDNGHHRENGRQKQPQGQVLFLYVCIFPVPALTLPRVPNDFLLFSG